MKGAIICNYIANCDILYKKNLKIAIEKVAADMDFALTSDEVREIALVLADLKASKSKAKQSIQ